MAPPLPTPPDTQQNHHAEILDDEDGDMDGEVEHNTDRCQLFEPFDITEEPTSMISTKYPSQDTALRAALLSSELDVSDEFNSQSIQKRSVTAMSRMYEAMRTQGHVGKMTHRTRINWRNSEYVVPSTNQDIHWKTDDFFLDLLICRGKDVGLAAILPNLRVHHTIEFKLELGWSPRTFSPKFAHLDFDPIEAMQYIGRTHRAEDAWIAWIPEEAVGDSWDEHDPVAAGTCSGNTHISRRHYHGAFMFFAGELHRMGHRDISVWEKYPDLEDHNEVEFATNLGYVSFN